MNMNLVFIVVVENTGMVGSFDNDGEGNMISVFRLILSPGKKATAFCPRRIPEIGEQ